MKDLINARINYLQQERMDMFSRMWSLNEDCKYYRSDSFIVTQATVKIKIVEKSNDDNLNEINYLFDKLSRCI